MTSQFFIFMPSLSKILDALLLQTFWVQVLRVSSTSTRKKMCSSTNYITGTRTMSTITALAMWIANFMSSFVYHCSAELKLWFSFPLKQTSYAKSWVGRANIPSIDCCKRCRVGYPSNWRYYSPLIQPYQHQRFCI